MSAELLVSLSLLWDTNDCISTLPAFDLNRLDTDTISGTVVCAPAVPDTQATEAGCSWSSGVQGHPEQCSNDPILNGGGGGGKEGGVPVSGTTHL